MFKFQNAAKVIIFCRIFRVCNPDQICLFLFLLFIFFFFKKVNLSYSFGDTPINKSILLRYSSEELFLELWFDAEACLNGSNSTSIFQGLIVSILLIGIYFYYLFSSYISSFPSFTILDMVTILNKLILLVSLFFCIVLLSLKVK